MKEKLRFLGLDVHAETIAVAIAEPDGEVRSLGTIPNRAESIRKLIKKLGPADKLRACYEAGPTGYVVYWQLAELGIQCEEGSSFGSFDLSRPDCLGAAESLSDTFVRAGWRDIPFQVRPFLIGM